MMIAAAHIAQHVMVRTSFWPATLGAWAALVGGAAASGAVVLGARNRQKIQEIHLMVNGQRTEMQAALRSMTEKRDTLIDQREAGHDE